LGGIGSQVRVSGGIGFWGPGNKPFHFLIWLMVRRKVLLLFNSIGALEGFLGVYGREGKGGFLKFLKNFWKFGWTRFHGIIFPLNFLYNSKFWRKVNYF